MNENPETQPSAEVDGKRAVAAGMMTWREALGIQRLLLAIYLIKLVNPFVDPFFYGLGWIVGTAASVVYWARYMRHMFWHWVDDDIPRR